ncbi:MAG: MFS transporter [Arthrobacter sp.]|jgi:MFS family permease|nr:MFS transporter [Arthrobacter sp.]
MALRALAPFRHAPFRVLASALIISVFGHGLWAVSLVYQVRALGGGMIELSLATTALAIGLLACVLIGGVVADRLPRRRILLAVEIADTVTVGAIALLALTGGLQLWHLVAAAALVGASAAFFFPAYSALLPSVIPAEDLLAANGFEGAARPALQQAAGPATAGFIVAAASPGVALALLAACHLVAAVILAFLPPERDAHPAPDDAASPSTLGSPEAGPASAADPMGTAGTRPAAGSPGGEPGTHGDPTPSGTTSPFRDAIEGVKYTVRTPWLWWTLLFACVSVLSTVGPLEVLLPFVVSDQLGGDSRMFGGLLAVAGVAAMLGSLFTASRPLPRRYLTWMLVAWGLGTLPLAAVGFLSSWWLVAIGAFIYGATGAFGQVIWGTLLQRRVPRHMLGRVSSLDFFVSLALMPLSMALAGPLATVLPMWSIWVAAGVVTPLVAALAWWRGRLGEDELAHPLHLASRAESREEVGPAAPRGDAARDQAQG